MQQKFSVNTPFLITAIFLMWALTACAIPADSLPTRAAAVMLAVAPPPVIPTVPGTFTPLPPGATVDPYQNHNQPWQIGPSSTPSLTPPIPSHTPTPSATYTPSPTYTPSATRPPAVPNATYHYPFVIDPNKSKLSIHVIRPNSPTIEEFIRETQPNVIKLVDDFGLAAVTKELSPHTIVIGRVNNNNQQYQGNPEEEARRYVHENLAKYRANPDVDYWEGWNEPDPGLSHMAWYARFEQERIREMARQGLGTAIGGFATGVPEMNEFALFIPAIETAMQYGAILTLHEYSAPVINYGYGTDLPGYPYYADRGALTLRYRWYYREFLEPAGLVIPLAITEAGIDGIIGGRPGPPGYGWADFQSYAVEQGWGRDGIEAFVNQMAWYDAEVRKDAYVMGFTIFTAGSFGHWEKYEIRDVLPRLTNYARP
jgi:hypothetical protein